MSTKKKRNGKNWHYEPAKKRKCVLDTGLKGFMCTCNNTERQCIKETYNLLDEYANQLYGSQDAPVHSGDELTDELNAEIAALKKETEDPAEQRRFKIVDCGVKNRLFFRTTVPDPVTLVHHIMKSAKTSDERRTRYLMRITPVEITCKAYQKDIETAASTLLDKYFSGEGKTFSIVFNRHNNDFVGRSDVIGELAQMIKFRNPDHKVDLRHPQLTVLIEILRSVCCLSVVPDYMDFYKYNLMELYSRQKKDEVSSDKLALDVDPSEHINASLDYGSKLSLDQETSSDVSPGVDTTETVHVDVKDESKSSLDQEPSNDDKFPPGEDQRETIDASIKDGS
ncbi:THUMP domain-containing protein 1 [Anabrus simplex]|uniref:THUMP domain-containing protein 1 n=1 Tax=Anabrus simplex TaxID=316456 RepID=UPI0035A3C99C